MPRNTIGVKQIYTNTEFNEIVARGEQRLGTGNFIGHTEALPKIKNTVHVPVEQLINVFEQTTGDEYTEVFAKAVVSIKDIKDYRGSR